MSLAVQYSKEVIPTLQKALNRENILSLPRLQKVVINVGMGTWLQGGKDYAQIFDGVTALAGQRPLVKHSRLSISNFKLRKGMAVGIMVTLRGQKMYDFLERFINVAAPRIRDFQGFPTKSFDGRGNYSFGVDTYAVFPEISYKDVVKNYGIQITIGTSAKTDDEARLLLDSFGFPFKKTS